MKYSVVSSVIRVPLTEYQFRALLTLCPDEVITALEKKGARDIQFGEDVGRNILFECKPKNALKITNLLGGMLRGRPPLTTLRL